MVTQPFRKLAASSFIVLAAVAVAGDGVNLRITNDSIIDIFVTVRDTSARPAAVVVSHQRLNGFASIPVSVNSDESGLANVAWTAVRVDSSDHLCGHGEGRGLGNDAAVSVHADSDCGGN